MAPSSQRPRTDSQVAREAGDAEFRGRREIDLRDFVSSAAPGDQDLRGALRFLSAGWRSYGVMFSMDGAALAVDHPIFPSGLRSTPPTKGPIREGKDDPIPADSKAPGARMVGAGAHDWRGWADGMSPGSNGFPGAGIEKSPRPLGCETRLEDKPPPWLHGRLTGRRRGSIRRKRPRGFARSYGKLNFNLPLGGRVSWLAANHEY